MLAYPFFPSSHLTHASLSLLPTLQMLTYPFFPPYSCFLILAFLLPFFPPYSCFLISSFFIPSSYLINVSSSLLPPYSFFLIPSSHLTHASSSLLPTLLILPYPFFLPYSCFLTSSSPLSHAPISFLPTLLVLPNPFFPSTPSGLHSASPFSCYEDRVAIGSTGNRAPLSRFPSAPLILPYPYPTRSRFLIPSTLPTQLC
jgi:hypothetical protein